MKSYLLFVTLTVILLQCVSARVLHRDPQTMIRRGPLPSTTSGSDILSSRQGHPSRGGFIGQKKKYVNPCSDSDAQLGLKAAVSVAGETLGLLAVLKLAQLLSQLPWFAQWPVLNDVPLVQWLSFVFIIFNASAVKSLMDGGLSIASAQVWRPNVVPGDPAWYGGLQKPWFNPPGWLFPVMWIGVSKPTQLLAVLRLWKASSGSLRWLALSLYCVHLSLGDVWNQIFFGCQRLCLGYHTIVMFWWTLLASILVFGAVDGTAGVWLLPTFGWVSVALALNSEIARLNAAK